MKFNKSEIIGFNLTILLFVILILSGKFFTNKTAVQYSSAHLAEHFSDLEKEADEFVKDPDNISGLLSWAADSLLVNEKTLDEFKSYKDRPFQIAIVKNEQLVAWSSPQIVDLYNIPKTIGWQLVNDSIFVKRTEIRNNVGGPYSIIAQFSLPGIFTTQSGELSQTSAGKVAPILAKNNQIVAYPVSIDPAPNHTKEIWMIILYILAYLSLIQALSSFLRNNNHLRTGQLVIVILIPFIIRSIDYLFHIGLNIDQDLISLGIADKPFLSRAYGNLLLLIVFYFLFTDHILNKVRPTRWLRTQSYAKTKYSFVLFTLDYFGLVCLLIFCRELVVNSGINFDFNNVFNLGLGPLSSILILAILLFRYFLFSYKINLNLFKNKINFKYKVVGVFGSFLFMLPIIYLTNLSLPIYILLLVVLLFSLLFDIFIEIKVPTLGWLVIWIIFFAAFATVSLFKFNNDKEREEKFAIIEQLRNKDDSIFFKKFAQTAQYLKNNKQLNAGFSKAIKEGNDNLGIDMLQIAMSKEPYLQDFYAVDFIVKHKDSILISSHPDLIETTRLAGIKFNEGKVFLKAYNPDYFHSYFLKIYWQGLSLKPSPEVYFFIRKRLIATQSNFTENSSYFMNIAELQKYDYAIYKNDTLTESQGRIYPDKINIKAIMEHSEVLELNSQRRSELMSLIDDNTAIIIGKELLGIIKPISLFSFLFVLLILMAIIVSFVNSWIKILPIELPLLFSSRFNLRQRIEYSILLVIVASFGIIAWITSIYFKDLSYKMEENQISNKSYALVSDIENKLQNTSSDSLSDKYLTAIGIAHQTDFNVYNLNGTLHFESRYGGAGRNNYNKRIEPVAFLKLNYGGFPIYNQINPKSNSIDKAFLPIKNGKQVKVAWLEVPYTANNNVSYFAVSDFLGTLLNVYVFLLLVAGAIGIAVANSITRPLVNLVDKLKQIKLDKKNEPLQWSNQDEIGSLIMEYNNMIEKLEQSAILLVKSEREGAWRDMAQQVAHEIKNPLTPMKLSIQYLERKIATLPKETLEQTVKDTAKTIIEQIDNLASIATEFSNFAKMPAPVMEYINFNELVTSIHELFRKKDDMHFNLYLPIDDIIILADKSHLLRVLNNLVQNAIQSIPPDRTGQIGLYLKVEDNKAVLTVKDNGLGIPESMFDKVFYPSFTTKSSGMGLGLAMCKSIVESISGQISFRSKVDKGTEFIVKIPLAVALIEEEDSEEPE